MKNKISIKFQEEFDSSPSMEMYQQPTGEVAPVTSPNNSNQSPSQEDHELPIVAANYAIPNEDYEINAIIKGFMDDEVEEDEVNHEFFESMPPGYRFCPMDNELIVCYLRKKIAKHDLPNNQIRHVNLYRDSPDKISAKYPPIGDKEWYFFTPRNRKYKNGHRPNRAAGHGYWKATGADKQIRYKDTLVGYRKALVYYEGKPPKGTKSNWIMHEYRVDDPPREKTSPTDMRLDDFVLCRIYKKTDKSLKSQLPNEKLEDVDEKGCATPQGAEILHSNVLYPADMTIDTKNDICGIYEDQLNDIEAPSGFLRSQYPYQTGFPNISGMVDNTNCFSSSFQQLQKIPQLPLDSGLSPLCHKGNFYPMESTFMPKYLREGLMDIKPRGLGVQDCGWNLENLTLQSDLDFANSIAFHDLDNTIGNPPTTSPISMEISNSFLDRPPMPKRS